MGKKDTTGQKDTETLGQVAKDAFWDPEEIANSDMWEAVARAVVDEHERRKGGGKKPPKQMVFDDKQHQWGPWEEVTPMTRDLREAVARAVVAEHEAHQREQEIGVLIRERDEARAELERLQGVKRLWLEACEIARTHCPAEPGESHVRHGIPRLAAKLAEARAEAAKLDKENDQLRKKICRASERVEPPKDTPWWDRGEREKVSDWYTAGWDEKVRAFTIKYYGRVIGTIWFESTKLNTHGIVKAQAGGVVRSNEAASTICGKGALGIQLQAFARWIVTVWENTNKDATPR